MIYTKKDLELLEKFIEEFNDENLEYEGDYFQSGQYFFSENPYLLFASKLDISRPFYTKEAIDYFEEEGIDKDQIVKYIHESKMFLRTYGLKYNAFMEYKELAFHDLTSGGWYWLDGIKDNKSVYLHGSNIEKEIKLNDIYNNVKKIVDGYVSGHSSIILPRYYINFQNDSKSSLFKTNVEKTLQELYDKQIDLKSVSYSHFEDIVAELLINSGFEISQTPKTRDGGRDIIARAECGIGNYVTIAVEVKHKEKVGIPDIRNALEANRHYPQIMVVTSGTFSSEVIEEKKSQEKYLRLVLQDKIALSQLIQGYGDKKYKKT